MMHKIPDQSSCGRQKKVQVRESALFVAQGKSKRLAAMGKTKPDQSPTENFLHASEKEAIAGLRPEVAIELSKARRLINGKITVLMNSFPAGKQNKMFSFRFGSVDEIKNMNINAAFNMLGIDSNRVKMKLLAGLDYYGNDTKNDKNQSVL
jgi:hypothetical protein